MRSILTLLLAAVCGCTPSESQPARDASPALAELSSDVQRRQPWTTSRLRGTPEPPPPYHLEEAFGGVSFYNPVFVAPLPGTDQFLVGELCGRIYSVRKGEPNADPSLVIDLFKDFRDRPPTPTRGRVAVRTDDPLPSQQLQDLTFDPDFETNRRIFVTFLQKYLSSDTDAYMRLSSFELSSIDPPRIRRQSETRFLSWVGNGHNGGCVRFGPDGYLYISTGDGVMPNPPDIHNAGQDISNLHSSVLRIDVNRQDGYKPYAIPLDNPFRDHENARPEVWAYGFRNPWRMDFNNTTGDLWVGDVGWETWEMVYRVVAGGNYGWSIMEGRMPLRSDVAPGPTPILPPIKDHPRSEANSITGGVVYAGRKHEELNGWFVYGDYRTGRVWALDTNSVDELRHRELTESTVRIVAFAQDADGDIYALDHDFTGKIYRLVRSPDLTDAKAFPTRLSETGLFASVKDLTPAPGVIPYDVVVRRWMDGANAERLLALPGDTSLETVSVDGEPVWKYPEGSVLAKTLFYPVAKGRKRIPLETQILHYEAATWRAYSYAWNETQDDAVLVPREGAVRPGDEPNWHTVSRTECVSCHRPAQGYVLGFVPSQLDRDVGRGSVQRNQLELLADTGILSGPPTATSEKTVKLVDPHDASADLDERARSYLHVNCGFCHNRDGGSIVFFYLDKGLSLEESKAFAKPSVGDFGITDPRILAPGDPYRSMVLYRMGKLGNARMPYLGSYVVDSEGLTLVHDWIGSLDSEVEAPSQASNEFAANLKELSRLYQSDEDRDQAIHQTLSTTSGALALATYLHRDAFGDDFQARIVEKSQESPAAEVRSVFETFVPPSQRRKRLGPNVRAEDILAVKGEAARGKLIYESDSSRCRTCHIPDERGRPLGPELEQIAKKKYPRAEMLKQILEPSLHIDPEYMPHVLITSVGEVHSGLLIDKNDSEVVIRNTQLDVIRVPAAEVASFEKQTTSLMPDKLLNDLTAQEAADLLEFLVTLDAGGE